MESSGVACIVNKTNGKKFIFKSKNLVKKIENTRNQLNFGCHYNIELQEDWDNLGPDNFNFNILDSNIEYELNLNEKFHKYLNDSGYIYNKNVKELIQPLNCDIEILTHKLYDLTGNEINTQSFIQKLQQHGLTNQEGFDFKVRFINDIKQGLINHANFDERYEKFFSEFAENKIISSLMDTLDELDFDNRIEKYGLSEDVKLKIVEELKNKISIGEINNKEDISKNLVSLIEEENQKKLKKDKIYDKFYDLTGKENSLNREFKYELNRRELTKETGFKIKNDLKKLIEKEEVTLLNIEDVFNILIKEEYDKYQKKNYSKKQVLINFLEDMDFDNVLEEYILHKNHQFYIKEDITILINQDKIKSTDDIEYKSFRMIKDLEIRDVENRLKELDNELVDDIMVNNNLKSGFISRKQSKINKIIKNVPVDIIKENLVNFVGKLEPIYIPNPNIVYCPRCAAKNQNGAIFCEQCGSKIK